MRRPLLALMLAFLLLPGTAEARRLETTPARGFATVLARAEPGDTIVLAPGTYRESELQVRDDDLRILATGATLAGPGHGTGLTLAGHDGVRIAGLRVRGFGWGIFIDSGRGLTLRRVVARDNEVGLRATEESSGGRVSGLTLRRSSLSHNQLLGFDCTPGPCDNTSIIASRFVGNGIGDDTAADGIGFEPGSRGVLVRRSLAADNAGDGFDFKAAAVRIARSRSIGNVRNGIKLWGGGAVVNSLVAESGQAGLVLTAVSGQPSFRVVNSTFTANGIDSGDYGEVVGYEGEGLELLLRNNIFALNNSAVFLGPEVKLSEDHNLYFNPNRDYEIQFEFPEFTSLCPKTGRMYEACP